MAIWLKYRLSSQGTSIDKHAHAGTAYSVPEAQGVHERYLCLGCCWYSKFAAS